MTWSLRGLLRSLTSIALVGMVAGSREGAGASPAVPGRGAGLEAV